MVVSGPWSANRIDRRPRLGKLRDTLTEDEAEQAGAVFLTHQRFIEAVASRHAPGPDHVPDIVQAVAVQVCRGLNGFREESEITTWLFRVTVNTSRKYFKRERRQDLALDALQRFPTPEAVPENVTDQVVSGERIAALHDAVARLRPADQDIICDELKETGVLLTDRRARHRAQKRLHRVRKRLKVLLKDDPRLES